MLILAICFNFIQSFAKVLSLPFKAYNDIVENLTRMDMWKHKKERYLETLKCITEEGL